jgi:hypothetical protein
MAAPPSEGEADAIRFIEANFSTTGFGNAGDALFQTIKAPRRPPPTSLSTPSLIDKRI